jgi:hypothetical protein
MKTAIILLALSALALAGCMTDRTKSLLNPPGIHVSDDEKSDAAKVGLLPAVQYYAALEAAKDKSGPDATIPVFIDKGIGLVSGYCLRWFQRLDDTQRIVALQQKDFNIIRQLGTALLGIGSASSSIVAVYGAANTAYSGIVENFNEAVLAGPTTAKIKGQMLEMLKQSEDKLRADQARLTFSQAYSRIELHADTCTYSTVRNLLDASLASTQAKRDPETGKITSERVESTYQFDDASAKLQNFWRPAGTTNAANQKALSDWMSKNSLTVSIVMLINTPEYALFRSKAIKDLKL